jgi:hypothetical protein
VKAYEVGLYDNGDKGETCRGEVGLVDLNAAEPLPGEYCGPMKVLVANSTQSHHIVSLVGEYAALLGE